MPLVESLKIRARQLKSEVGALFLAFRDPRTPWYAKAWLALVLAYLASPVDLVPDFIPVIGYLDDLLLVPAGLALAVKMIPRDVLEECRRRAATGAGNRPVGKASPAVVIAFLVVLAAAACLTAYSFLPRKDRPLAPAEAVPGYAAKTAVRDPLPSSEFRFDLACRRPDAPLLLKALVEDSVGIVDVDSVTDLSYTIIRARTLKARFALLFRPKIVTRRVARSSGDGRYDQEYLDGYFIPEKYRPFVSEVRLPDPQVE